MRRLPQLETASLRWTLPMADRSAAALAEAVLADDPAESAALLAERLADDPPLALWTLLAARREPPGPRSLSELGAWLGRHAVAVLQWNPKRDASPDACDDPQAETYADLVAERLTLADTAALLAASDGQPAAEAAYLAGLLHQPSAWAEAAASGAAKPRLPEAILDPDSAAADYVKTAADVLAGKGPPAAADLDIETCRGRARQRREAWLESVAGLADRLPALMARLARLDNLEHSFHQTLEAEKLAAMAEFAAGAGHEINNPLAIIGGRAQLLLQEEADPERRRDLALMNAQVRRAHEMIADMRLFARPPQPEPESFDLAELVDALVADLGPQLAHRAISIERGGESGPLEIEADPAQLQVALRAMCKNSLEAIGHGGRIEIRLARRGDDVLIQVDDDGPGIEPDQRRHLFDPFYSARQAGRGLGLGLSKCWRIVTNHGGRIDVSAEAGRGASFVITLPRRPAAPPPGA